MTPKRYPIPNSPPERILQHIKQKKESVVSLTPFSVLYVEGFFPEDCLVLGNVLVS